MNFVSLVYLARAFAATIRRILCSTQDCLYLLSAGAECFAETPPHLRASVDIAVPE